MLSLQQKFKVLFWWWLFQPRRYEFWLEQTAKGLSDLQAFYKAEDVPDYFL